MRVFIFCLLLLLPSLGQQLASYNPFCPLEFWYCYSKFAIRSITLNLDARVGRLSERNMATDPMCVMASAKSRYVHKHKITAAKSGIKNKLLATYFNIYYAARYIHSWTNKKIHMTLVTSYPMSIVILFFCLAYAKLFAKFLFASQLKMLLQNCWWLYNFLPLLLLLKMMA